MSELEKQVDLIRAILGDLDEWGTPKSKLPDCPLCGEDELGVIHGRLVMCYLCCARYSREGILP